MISDRQEAARVMMISCPKCSFSQPDDQYCAKCGVNMVVFRTKAKSARSRLLFNKTLQISTLSIVAFLGLWIVRLSHRSDDEPFGIESASSLSKVSPTHQITNRMSAQITKARLDLRQDREKMNETQSASVAAVSNVPPDVSRRPAAPQDGASLGASLGAANTAASVKTDLSQPTSAAASLRSVLQPAQAVRVYFIEAQRATLADLMSDARDSSGDGTITYGIVGGLEQRLQRMRGWQSLDSAPDQPIHLNQPNLIVKGTRDPASGQTIGLTVQVIPFTRDEAGTRLQIDANRTLRDSGSGVESYNFQLPDSFMIPKGASFIMTGVLPHRAAGPDEQSLYRTVNVLKPLTSEPFRSGSTNTEVAIIVEMRP